MERLPDHFHRRQLPSVSCRGRNGGLRVWKNDGKERQEEGEEGEEDWEEGAQSDDGGSSSASASAREDLGHQGLRRRHSSSDERWKSRTSPPPPTPPTGLWPLSSPMPAYIGCTFFVKVFTFLWFYRVAYYDSDVNNTLAFGLCLTTVACELILRVVALYTTCPTNWNDRVKKWGYHIFVFTNDFLNIFSFSFPTGNKPLAICRVVAHIVSTASLDAVFWVSANKDGNPLDKSHFYLSTFLMVAETHLEASVFELIIQKPVTKLPIFPALTAIANQVDLYQNSNRQVENLTA